MDALQGVSATLFIPLVARIFVSKAFPEYFYDEKALILEKYIPTDSIRKNSSEYAMMASVSRYHLMDAAANAFCQKHKCCNLVYLGAGLETAYDRLGKRKAMFYQVDLPDVIAARQSVLGCHDNECLIGGDLLDLSWAQKVDNDIPTLMIVSGVFQYFTETQVAGFIADIQKLFPKGELIFDATNEDGLQYANRYVKKTGNATAQMHFFVNDSAAFARRTDTILIEERPFFTDARKQLAKRLKIYTRIAMRVVDRKKRAIIIHLGLNGVRC